MAASVSYPLFFSRSKNPKNPYLKRIKRWWVTNADGSVQLTIRYGSKPIELAKGKNAIELSSASEIASTLPTKWPRRARSP